MIPKPWKEPVEQSAHFSWALLATVALLTGGWWSAFGAVNWVVILARECWQKRDERYLIFSNFPWLDASFYALGGVAGIAVGALFS